MVPVGVGNNSTLINLSLLQKPSDTSVFGESDASHFNRESSKDFDTQSSEPWTDGFWKASEGDNSDEGEGNADVEGDVDDEGGSEDGDGDVARSMGRKRKGKEKAAGPKKRTKVDEKKPTAPRPAKSTPAPTQKKTSKSAIDKFSEIAAKEEETTQKVIELKKTKLKALADKEIAKVKSKAEIKMNQDRLCAELEMKKMEYGYRFRFAATQPGGAPLQPPPLFSKFQISQMKPIRKRLEASPPILVHQTPSAQVDPGPKPSQVAHPVPLNRSQRSPISFETTRWTSILAN